MHFDDTGELIVENLLLQGQSLMSDCIQTVCEKLDNRTKDEAGSYIVKWPHHLKCLLLPAVGEVVKNTFQKMVDAKLLQRVKLSTGESEADNATVTKYQLPPTEGYWSFCDCTQ